MTRRRPQNPDFFADPHAGAIPGALRGPPGKVPSPRTGRPVAPSTAQIEYGQSFDAVPVRKEAMHGGFWDFDQEALQGPRRGPPVPERYDAEGMRGYVATHELSPYQRQVYECFWLKRLSYAQVAKRIGATNARRVYEAVVRIRIKAAGT